jgi:tetratricopeptide (TPR) repeat protein
VLIVQTDFNNNIGDFSKMRNIYYSLAVAIIVMFLPTFLGISFVWTFLPGLIAGVATFWFTSKYFSKKIEALMQQAAQEVQGLQPLQIQASQGRLSIEQYRMIAENKINQAVEHFKSALTFSKWQYGLDISINSQIGMLIYSFQASLPKNGDIMKAFEYLEKSLVKGAQAKIFAQLWHSWLRLAICYFKIKQDLKKTEEIMEIVVDNNPKEGFAWNMYAWFFWKAKKQEEALVVLAKGVAQSTDPILKKNWNAVQNNLPMDMTEYGESWYALGLEKPKQQVVQQSSPLFSNPKILAKGSRR